MRQKESAAQEGGESFNGSSEPLYVPVPEDVGTFTPKIRVPEWALEQARERYEETPEDIAGEATFQDFLCDYIQGFRFIREEPVPAVCHRCNHQWLYGGVKETATCPCCMTKTDV